MNISYAAEGGQPVTDVRLDLASLLAGVTYKPGWRFKAGGPGNHMVCVFATTPDSNNPTRHRTTQHQFWVPPEVAGEHVAFYRWLFGRLLQAELHEAGEFFAVDGFRPHMPHHQDEGDPYDLVDRWET